LKEEPNVSPDAIASLPAEPPAGTTTTAGSSATTADSSATTTPPAGDSSSGSSAGTSTEPPQVVEEPSPALVMQYIQPLLAKGITTAELPWKLGKEKGKNWTALFNEMLDYIIGLRNQRVSPTVIHGSARQCYGTTLGSLVAALVKFPRSADGRVHVSAETDVLNSNPHSGSTRTTKSTAKDTKNELQGGSTTADRVVNHVVPEDDYAGFWAVDGPWTIDDALRTMEPAWVVWSQPSTRCHEAPMGSSQQG